MLGAGSESREPLCGTDHGFKDSRGNGGKETIQALLQIDPEVRAIVASGYSNDPVMADFRRYEFFGLIPKPFSLSSSVKCYGRS
jgi:hypothetical protein